MSDDLQQVAATLSAELGQPQPCIASASIALGVLQQRLMDHNVAAAGTYKVTLHASTLAAPVGLLWQHCTWGSSVPTCSGFMCLC
jgi:hypothetical protein